MKQNNVGGNSSKSNDSDMVVFIAMSRELKEEGNKLFRKRDFEGAMVIYEKALKLLPKNHIDVCHLRTNIAACNMQMGLSRCYESLNKLDLAFRDVNAVLNMEPNNTMTLEISQRVRSSLEKQGLLVELPPKSIEPQSASKTPKVVKEKTKNRTKNKKKISEAQYNKVVDQIEEKKVDENVDEKKAEDKYVEPPSASQTLKVVKGKTKKKKKNNSEAQDDKVVDRIEEKKVDENVEEKKAEDKCVEPPSASQTSKGIKAKTKNKKKISEAQDDKVVDRIEEKKVDENVEEKKAEDKQVVEEKISSKTEVPKKSTKLILGEDIRWARLPLNCSLVQLREVIHDRFPSSREVLVKYSDEEEVDSKQDPFFERFKRENDTYLNLHEIGMKQYSEAMEDTVTSEEAQNLFDMAAQKFQEMTALALFDWGNIHMSRARKMVYISEEGKLYWYYAITNNVDPETWPSENVLHLYNNAEENMERGLPVWHECLEVAIEKFEHAGVSPTDIAVMVKNHCSNNIALKGLGLRSMR
ncbi:hypothetical protein F3Y22_tig00110893pilonHSYRG00806 [Hibiscus syriacus]|uniref:Uncharacterized protein n=1 Tax=Hibiscus syriacus TaxID=106335 RepID=A0A6A2ZGX3_HIBSY|nr:hypothetical protein F3Y22_tig00110893pilonHSYRG00806 [Hibiscus syriacus]